MKQSQSVKNEKTVVSQSGPSAKGRRFVRKGNVLRYAVTPKTRSSLSERTVKHPLPVATMRAIYIFCGLLFLGTGMYNMLF